MGISEFSAVGLTWNNTSSTGGVEILLAASCYGKQKRVRPDEPLGSYADLTFSSLCFFFRRIALHQCYTQGLALKFRMAITCLLNTGMFDAKGRYEFFHEVIP